MNFIEFVAFVVTMFAMVWLMIRRAKEAPPMEELPEEEREQLKEFMQSLGVEMEVAKPKEEPPPPPKPKPAKITRPVSTAYTGKYALHTAPSRIKNIVEGLPARKQIIIIRDVLSPPKGL